MEAGEIKVLRASNVDKNENALFGFIMESENETPVECEVKVFGDVNLKNSIPCDTEGYDNVIIYEVQQRRGDAYIVIRAKKNCTFKVYALDDEQ